MESFPTLRGLPRRIALCFFFICIIFLICAFYSFGDSKNSSIASSDFIDVTESKDTDSKPSPSFIVQDRFISSNRESSSSGLLESTTNGASSTKNDSSNLSDSEKPKSTDSVQITKYIFLRNSSSSKTASVTVATTTPLPDTCSLSAGHSKLILLWTPFFDYWNYLSTESFRRCPRCKNCKVTRDRSKLLESHAVIFHARDMSVSDMPPVRLPHQRWIFYCLESPPYSDFPGLQYAQNMFNWTMTYRSDSDITTPYGYIYKTRPPRKVDMQSLESAWFNKSRSVVWMSSHCPTHGGRDAFAAELKKYIDVDTYGTCGTSICPPGETEQCLLEFAQKYKFFLAFENSLCRDYITEKFFRTLKYNIIPVVFGGANYDKFAPPGSFIDALSFKSPKHLAFFLTGVGRNFKLYSSFFKWRKDYAVSLGNGKECQLCSLLHKKNSKPSSYANLREWWVKGSKCKIWEPKG